MEPKVEVFFYGMVTGTFEPFESYSLDEQSVQLNEKLKNDLRKRRSLSDGNFALCELLTYTQDLSFAWKDEVPEQYKNLEVVWTMHKEGRSILDIATYFGKNVSTDMLDQWWKAKKTAMKIWKPADEKSPKDREDEAGDEDPNSQSDNG